MSPWLWLPLGAAGLAAAWWIAPRILVKPDEDEGDQPTEEVSPDAEGLGIRDANPFGGFLGSAPPDFAPPDAGDELEHGEE